MSESKERHRIAVVGAGMSGLAAATRLTEMGHAVVVFDKGRGAGGRMSRRRVDSYQFDHGAQYFTVRHPEFERQVVAWRAKEIVALWNPRLIAIDATTGNRTEKPNTTARYVGIPGMNAPAEDLADGLDVRYSSKIVSVRRNTSNYSFSIEDQEDVGGFDAVVLAVTPEQALQILPSENAVARQSASIALEPCWAVMAVFADDLHPTFDAAFVNGAAIRWAARDRSKQGRPSHEAWTIHTTPTWSRANLDLDESRVQEVIVGEFQSLTRFPTPLWVAAHRWRYAQPRGGDHGGPILDGTLGVCGDWCYGSRVEDAFQSGVHIAEQLLSNLKGA